MTNGCREMMQSDFCQEREKLIAECLPGLISELRLVDVEYLVAFVTLQMLNNIADLVDSASERYFSPGFITMGQGCEVALDWDSAPVITLDLIMQLGWGKAYFSVMMRADCADVRLNYFSADHPAVDAEANTNLLRQSIQLNHLRCLSSAK